MGVLYVVATPIGNLGDLSPRAVETLRSVHLIAAEDTRHTGKLLAHFGVETPMVSYHAFNERRRAEGLLAALAAGDVALVSDAGTPGISDPGQGLVAAAAGAGFEVRPVPGPSAATAAVSASGLVEGPWTFLGFLPRGEAERRALLTRARGTGFALVLFEAANRVVETLRDARAVVGEREAVVAREVSKLYEEFLRGTVAELIERLDGVEIKGEVVIVVGPGAVVGDEEEPREVVARLLGAGMKPSEAAREAAALTGLARSELYLVALELKGR